MMTQPGLAPTKEQDLPAFMIALGDDVIGRWVVHNQRRVHKWTEKAAAANSKVWGSIPSPVALFFMRADVNRRCHRYYWEAEGLWHLQWYLQPFLKAVEYGIVETVVIPWGHGVVASVAKSTNGLVIKDMFREKDVVFRVPDIRQGNRANTMAAWWYRPQDRGQDWCDLIFGVYSPVHAAFTGGDRDRLLETLDRRSDIIKQLADRLVKRNVEYVETEARRSLASSPPDPWRTFAIVATELEFLQVAACTVLDKGQLRSVEICSHPFRSAVALELPRVLKAQGKQKWSVGSARWHPLDELPRFELLTQPVAEDLLLLVRGRADRRFVESAARELAERPPLFTQLETALQLCCHGLPASTSLDPYPSVVVLARCGGVRSITLVRVPRKSRPLRSLPKYPPSLSNAGRAPKYTLAERRVPQVLLHVEAYCDDTAASKEWVRDLLKDLSKAGLEVRRKSTDLQVPYAKDCSFLRRLSSLSMGGTFPVIQVGADQKVQLLLYSDRGLRPQTVSAVTELLANHLLAIRNERLHLDPDVNRALTFYKQHAWDHDCLQDPTHPTFKSASAWLDAEFVGETDGATKRSRSSESAEQFAESLKALLMNHDHEGFRPFDLLSQDQTGDTPRHVSMRMMQLACRKLKINLTTNIDIQERITLPVAPGLPFLVALRSAMGRLNVRDAELQVISTGASRTSATYTLRIPCGRSTAVLDSSYQHALRQGPGTVGDDAAWALVCLRHSKTYGAPSPGGEYLQCFEGLVADVCEIRIDNELRSVFVSWDALAPFSAGGLESPEQSAPLRTADLPSLFNRTYLDDRSIDDVAQLVEAAAILLNEDRMPGNWGRTIAQYMAVTQPEGRWSEMEIANIVSSGSLTHTYHALDGLLAYHRLASRPFSVGLASNVHRYLKTWRLENGAFASPVTNFDASAGSPEHVGSVDPDLFRRQVPQLLRHTAAGVLTINRLLELAHLARGNAPADVRAWSELPLADYALKALRLIGSYSAQLELQMDSRNAAGWTTIWGKAKYTPAYIVLAVEEGLGRFGDQLTGETRLELQKVRALLIEYILAYGIENAERFLCEGANSQACYYYTVLILEHFLAVETFVQDPRAAAFCHGLVGALNEVIRGVGGLPYGNSNIPEKPWLGFADVGVTARYLGVLQSYGRAFASCHEPAVAEAARRALSFVIAGYRDLERYARNQLTHGWEAFLKLPVVFDAEARSIVARRLSDDSVVVRANEFARMVASRCFVGRTAIDERWRLVRYLRDLPVFLAATEVVAPDVSDAGVLRGAIETVFSRGSLAEFLAGHNIPFRKDASFEQMIADLLWQFGFEPLVASDWSMVQ